MRNLPLAAFVLLFAFCSNNLFAQTLSNSTEVNSISRIIKSSNNGKLNYSYSATNNNQYSVEIVIKNDQFIYKQEIDTLQIQSAEAFTLLKQDLQYALTALQNANPNFKIQRPNYLLVEEDKGVAGLFMVLSNPTGTINTANTKFQIRVLLEWLNTIEFGKSQN
jgi:asparagine N-glycosylation enzyme membrane subunit Stt3